MYELIKCFSHTDSIMFCLHTLFSACKRRHPNCMSHFLHGELVMHIHMFKICPYCPYWNKLDNRKSRATICQRSTYEIVGSRSKCCPKCLQKVFIHTHFLFGLCKSNASSLIRLFCCKQRPFDPAWPWFGGNRCIVGRYRGQWAVSRRR